MAVVQIYNTTKLLLGLVLHAFALPPPQLLYCCVCCMQLLVSLPIPGTDLATDQRIKTPTQAMVRNCGYITSVSAHILVCKCIYVRLCSACNTDQGSCGCCQMLRETNRLSTYFTMSLNKLEKEYLQTKQSFASIEGEWHIHELHEAGQSAYHKSILKNAHTI